MSGQHRPHGGLEAEVLDSLVGVEEALTVASIKLRLDESLAYTTVSTTLTRLHEKGLLRREQRGRALAYALALPPEAAQATTTARQMHRLMDSSENRRAVLDRFVAGLSPDDEHLLLELLTRRPD